MMLNGLPDNFSGYKDLSEEERSYAHYTILKAASRCLQEHELRLKLIEKRKFWNTAAAGAGGVFGGIIAFFGSKLWG